MITGNGYMMNSGAERKAGGGGRALLSGLLRCHRCGRMMQVNYPGPVVRYVCNSARSQYGEKMCISFGCWRVDDVMSKEVLAAVSGNAITASFEPPQQMQQNRQPL